MPRNNESWLEHLKSGAPEQQAALSDLRDALIRGLRGALSRHGSFNDSFLEDAAQDSLVRILERLHQFEGRSHFLTWATSVAIRVAMSELRRRRWRDVTLDEVITDSGLALERVVDDSATPDIQWERKAIVGKVFEVIRHELTEKQRTVLLAELKGMPQEEIARQIGSNRNAVYKLTHDARSRLKRGLEAAGYNAADLLAVFAK